MTRPTLTRVRRAYARIEAADRPEVWIDLRPQAEVEQEARAIDDRVAAGEHLPLAGKLFAAKGNIDVAGLPTTAGCPAYAYPRRRDAPVVARLRAAGAIVLGTTNLDQFATGLVGTRSPHGAVRNAIDPARISGGSSSGSAVAVALGIVDLALGTDTAGSGRIPGRLQRHRRPQADPRPGPHDRRRPGLRLPRLRDRLRPYAPGGRAGPRVHDLPARTRPPRTPPANARPMAHRRRLPGTARRAGRGLGDGVRGGRSANSRRPAPSCATIDLTPFTEAAAMLYEGAFVAERYTAVGSFVDKLIAEGGAGLDPTVAGIITRARDIPAHQLYADQDRLAALRTRALAQLGDADALLLPTAPGHPTLAEVAADPLGANARLGRFTNSTNLFDLAAVAVPAGEVAGLPFGVMLIGPAFTDERLARIARPCCSRRPGSRWWAPTCRASPSTANSSPWAPGWNVRQPPPPSTACTPCRPRRPSRASSTSAEGRRRHRGRGLATPRRGPGAPARRAPPPDDPGPRRTGRRQTRTRLPLRTVRTRRSGGHHDVRRLARIPELYPAPPKSEERGSRGHGS